MCDLRAILTIAVSIAMFFGCLSLSLYLNPTSQRQSNANKVSQIQPRPDATARLKDMMSYRMEPFQPQATEILVERLSSHLRKKKPSRPLVLSFQGCEDCGQMIALEIIGQAVFDYQHRSKCIFAVNINMVDKWTDEQHEKHIFNDVISHLQQCPRAVMYFDEIDLLSPAMHNSIEKMIFNKAWNSSFPSPNFATFVFVSGAGATSLLQLMHRHNFERDSVSLSYAQSALVQLFQPGSDFWNHKMAAQINWPRVALRLERSILSFVPFFPLRRVDVAACLKGEVLYSLATMKEFDLLDSYSVVDDLAPWLMQHYTHPFFEIEPFISKKGCRGPTDLVARHVYGGVQVLVKQHSDGRPFAGKHVHVSAPPKMPRTTPNSAPIPTSTSTTHDDATVTVEDQNDKPREVSDNDDDDDEDELEPIAAVTSFDGGRAPRDAHVRRKEIAHQYRVSLRAFKQAKKEPGVGQPGSNDHVMPPPNQPGGNPHAYSSSRGGRMPYKSEL